jgi:hypothetical protein
MHKAIIAGLIAAALSGCATVYQGGTQAIKLNSTPDAATITIINSAGDTVHRGATPISVALKRGAGYFRGESYTVRIEKGGFKPAEIALNATISGWYFGNLLIGGVIGMLVVDPLSGAMYTLAPDVVGANMDQAQASSWNKDGSLMITMLQDVPVAMMKKARIIQPQRIEPQAVPAK